MSSGSPSASFLSLPVRRPVATTMFFFGIVLLGLIGWRQMPVELIPALSGDELYVRFSRPGSEPEVVEREILLPLQAKVESLPQVSESWGEVRGSSGSYRVRFERGADLKVRELELQQAASELARAQPPGTFVTVQAFDTSTISRFVMRVQVVGGDDLNALYDLVEESIKPRLESVSGVGQVFTSGASPRQVSLRIDTDRCSALGVTTEQVLGAVRQALRRLRFVGGLENAAGRTPVLIDGRPEGPVSLGEVLVDRERGVRLRHVGTVEVGSGREERLYRVDGQPSVGLYVFQEQGANLVRLGHALRRRIAEVRADVQPLGLDLLIRDDGAQVIEDQITYLEKLALWGFVLALVVLYLFLRQWRAVAVVAIAAPVSLLAALALLYLFGQTFNLLTVLGLAVGIGLLVDNSVVVYEATQRQLEHGRSPADAAVAGARRTVRAITAASTTTAVAFLPIALVDIESTLVRSLIQVVALAILLPLLASLLIAVGLVPLLAHRLAAPAAIRRLAELRRRKLERGGRVPPQRVTALFSGFLSAALRRPAALVTAVLVALVVTVVIALPWLAVNTGLAAAPNSDTVQVEVELSGNRDSLTATTGVFDRLARSVQSQPGVERVESLVEEQSGSLVVQLVDRDQREAGTAAKVRETIDKEAKALGNVEILEPGERGGPGGGGGGGGAQGDLAQLLGQTSREIVLSGPDSQRLERIAGEIEGRLEAVPEIAAAWQSAQPGLPEIRVTPQRRTLEAFGLTIDQLIPELRLVGREGVASQDRFSMPDGRQLPLVVYRESSSAAASLQDARITTPAGPLPLASLASVRLLPPTSAIQHHNGRREMSVHYRLRPDAPSSGPERLALDQRIEQLIGEAYRPPGYSVELKEDDQGTSWFRKVLLPVVLLLFLVLAMTFESATMPILVLLSLPLTVLGSVWALALSGQGFTAFAAAGALLLLGLTVNPAILLVDRMQQRVLGGGWSAGAAALAAVRERARPVLMTTATTVVALAPMAVTTGRENEIWPPLATIVIGGLATSTLLTLIIIPVGFVFLRRLDRLFGRLGPWVMVGIGVLAAAVMTPLIMAGLITSTTWQILTTVLVAAGLLALAALIVWRPDLPEPHAEGGPPAVDVRHLRKTYGLPGPMGRAWRAPERFARRLLTHGLHAFNPRDARDRLIPLALIGVGLGYLAYLLQPGIRQLLVIIAAALAGGWTLVEARRGRGLADELGRVLPGGLESVAAHLLPWAALGLFASQAFGVDAGAARHGPDRGILVETGLAAVVLAISQLGRRTARRVSRGAIAERVGAGALRRTRTLWRRLARRVFGLDLPRDEVRALAAVSFRAERGMIGVLGPNGAGKTTLLRMLAGILDPTRGNILVGAVPMRRIRRHLARWVGYLPQEANLPRAMTAREYLSYFALLYQLPAEEVEPRIGGLLAEVGLAERADEKIGSYSGGMRQRVAVARTLLRLPPIIIVDEPTVGLDPRERIRFRNLLVRLAHERVVFFSTHVVEDVAVACERVLVLARGRLVFDGAPQDLSDVAAGKVWRLNVPDEEPLELPEGAVLADQVPSPTGGTVVRILSSSVPHPRAEPVDPEIEDGYLRLVGRGLT